MEQWTEDLTDRGTEELFNDNENLFDAFLSQRGHQTEATGWDQNYNKKQCPECGGLHNSSASECSVCGWMP